MHTANNDGLPSLHHSRIQTLLSLVNLCCNVSRVSGHRFNLPSLIAPNGMVLVQICILVKVAELQRPTVSMMLKIACSHCSISAHSLIPDLHLASTMPWFRLLLINWLVLLSRYSLLTLYSTMCIFTRTRIHCWTVPT